jgi:hypothetical protein
MIGLPTLTKMATNQVNPCRTVRIWFSNIALDIDAAQGFGLSNSFAPATLKDSVWATKPHFPPNYRDGAVKQPATVVSPSAPDIGSKPIKTLKDSMWAWTGDASVRLSFIIAAFQILSLSCRRNGINGKQQWQAENINIWDLTRPVCIMRRSLTDR